ncbi:unnamed protein product [Kuraishia capsulata CBS 1993]|uniref:THUMP domain-containing protein n=1 Tax=Kuraishia capsulata CBS 1993 TaxID=1382522 RepID=W6MSR8_9ASCO|nr:uncharacterized protein KUCA_T00005855001 [Kuraishia capsulata CBS 1993]CDK29861.1 unnamed protein product [Kuraishia capsulata CBS 1993]
MGKRGANGNSGGQKKKFKLATGIIEPGQYGVLATCQRGKELGCAKELRILFGDNIEKYFDMSENKEDVEDKEEASEELSVEDAIKKELSDISTPKTDNKSKEIVKSIDLGCDCLVFIKTRRPIIPSVLVQRLCRDSLDSKTKSTRFTLRLTPIDDSCTPTEEELQKMALSLIAPVFHGAEGEQKPYKFAVSVTKRNFNSLDQPTITRIVAKIVGNDRGHSVDLKNPDKLILVSGYKSNIGMAIVDGKEYEELCRFNLQQIFEKSQE